MTGQGGFTRSEVYEMLGLTHRAVGHYENLERISPAGRGREKRYSRREITRLKLILRGRRFGMSLEEIRRWLNLYSEAGKLRQLMAWIDIADQRLDALRAERAELAQKTGNFRPCAARLRKPSPATGMSRRTATR